MSAVSPRRRAGPPRAPILAAILLAAALLAAGGAAANIFVVDDRVTRARDDGSPFAAVGVITQTTPGRDIRFGTATLIGPCHALTAHHTAFRTPERAGTGEASLLYFGPPDGDFPFADRVTAHPVAWGDLAAHTHEDWAVLRLETCVGERWGWWPVEAMSAEDAMARPGAFADAGYPAVGPREVVTVDPECTVHEAAGSVPGWGIDCAVRRGQSGGPVFYRDGDGRPRLVAIVKGDFFPYDGVIPRWDRNGANIAIPVANFIERIRPFVGR